MAATIVCDLVVHDNLVISGTPAIDGDSIVDRPPTTGRGKQERVCGWELDGNESFGR